MKNFFSPQRRYCLRHTPHKITTICLLVALLSGLIPPPTAQSMAIVPLPDAVVAPVSDMAAAGLPTVAIVADRPVEAVVAALPASVVANAVPGGTTSTQITGNVFRDFSSDGMKSTGTVIDTGVSGVTVTAYDATGSQAGAATTDSNGDYTLSGLTAGETYRIEFSTLPTGYYPTTHGSGVGDTNGTTVQFAAAGTSRVSLGVNQPCDYCQTNPLLVTNRYIFAKQPDATLLSVQYNYLNETDGNINGTGPRPYSPSRPLPATLATNSQIGAIWGLAWNRDQKILYSSAYLKRHTIFGGLSSESPGAIYQTNMSGATPVTTLFADLNTIFAAGTAGTNLHPSASTDLDTDPNVKDLVGKSSLGDLEITPDLSMLYVINLTDRQLYSLPTSGPLNSSTVLRYAVPTANLPTTTGTCAATDVRPFGLGINNLGEVYVGAVCSAESTPTTYSNMMAYVWRFNPVAASFTLVLSGPLNFSRDEGTPNYVAGGYQTWSPWKTSVNSALETYPQPMLSDIVFDGDDLVLGFRDRYGDQGSPYHNNSPRAYGDILRACPGGIGWVLENNGTCGDVTTGGANDAGGDSDFGNYGPGGGEYYWQDNTGDNSTEGIAGGLLQIPGFPDVVASSHDPIYRNSSGTYLKNIYDAAGFQRFSNLTGQQNGAYEVFLDADTYAKVTFGKMNGIGDIEVLCDPAPIEIGNRVWLDENHNGIQDPDENVIQSVTVVLTDGNGNNYTAVTNAQGEYYFNGSNVSGGLQPNTAYTLTIDTTQTRLIGYEPAPSNVVTTSTTIADGVDSDGIQVGDVARITLTTGGPGENDHSFDFGFHPSALSLGNRLWYDTNNDGLDNDGTGGGLGHGISGVTMQLLDSLNTVIMTTTTDANGYYRFDNLTDGSTYTVLIPASNFASGGKLQGYQNSTATFSADPNTSADDANDNGTMTGTLGSGGDVRSAAITLIEGTLPMGEPAIGGGTHAPDGDRHDDLTVDFGFYKLTLGNRVWYDDNRDGLDGTETGAVGIPVTLTTGSGVFVATTTTDGSGYYNFTNLISGTYIVQIQAPANYLSSATDDATTNTDLNDNGQGNSGGLITSQVVALTPGSNGGAITVESTHGHTHNLTMDFGLYRPTADLQVLKRVNPPTYTVGVATPVTFTVVITNYGPAAVVNAPVTDTQPVSVTFDSWSCTINGTGSCGTANGSGDINSTVTLDAGSAAIWIVNATIDNTADDPIVNTAREALPPGVLQDIANRPDQANANVVPAQALFSVGNRVWLDTNDDGASSGPGTAVGIPDGLMELVDLTTGQVIQTTYTDANGYYRFDGVPAGTYEIVAAASNFTTDRAIGYRNSSGVITTTTNITSGLPIIDFDDHDHGINSAAPTTINGVHSVPFRLGPGLQPIGEAAVGGGDDGPYGDANSNLTIDFGFNRQHTGNQLWYDTDNDGVYEPGDGEQPLPAGVVVVMHAIVGGIDTGPVLTTTTDLNGQYNFDAVNNFDLDPIGNPLLIYIAIPAGQAALNSYIPSTGVRHEGGGVDNENTGAINATGVVTSGLFYPLPGDTANGALVFDDLGETYQPTIDFGFVREAFTLGNRVWYDTDNDGFFDPTEQPVAGVVVELLDSSNNYLTETTTDASGYYSFTGLTAGSYLVEVTGSNFLPGAPLYGYQNSTPTTTTTTLADDNHDHGLNVVNGRPGIDGVSSDLVILGPGLQPTGESDGAHGPEGDANDNLTVDFGFYKLVLGNQTWDDEDNNGHYDPAINTTLVVNIRLYAADGVTEIPVGPDGVLGTADDATGGVTTGTNGRYEFSGLTPGEYIVKVKTPNGHVSSTGSGSPLIAGVYEPAPDPDDNLDEDDNGSDGSGADAGWLVSLPVTLTPGDAGDEGNNVVDNAKGSTTDPTVDFGYVHLVSLGNIIWDDLNNNGRYDSATESGIDGVLVNLYYDANGDGDVTDAGETTPLTTTTTTGGGLYLFANLLAGNYLVELDAGNFTTGSVLENYTSSTGRNGSVTGPYETAPDPDASGVDNDDNGTIAGTLGGGGVIRSAVITLDEGSEPTGEHPDNDAVTPDPNENLTVDFGVFRYAELGNYTWIDENKDGIQDSTEDPLAGVTVQLYNAADQLVASTNTGLTGHYTFTNLLPGDYSVKFIPPAGYAITQQDQGGDDTVDSDADPVTGQTISTNLVLDERDYTWDAGFLPTRFGDRVWIESDNDGLANTGTIIPVEGMVITATASSGDVYTITTNAAGYYSFTVVADTYTVTYGSVPAGYGVVVPSATPGGSSESGNAGNYAESGNPDQSHAQDTLVTVAAGETNWHVDFAFSAPRVSLGNRLFYDTNDDGMDNDGAGNTLGSSVGIDSATVQLYRDTNGNGSFDLGDEFVTTTQTLNGGYYTFTNLMPTAGITSTYLVVITSSNFIAGGPLAGYWSSTDIPTTLTPDGDVDFDDNGETMGLLGQPGGIVASRALALTVNGEPTGENNGGNDPTADDSSNQTVDFGFITPVNLGDFVWEDLDGDGQQKNGEPGIANVTVTLVDSNGNSRVTTTDGNGVYTFANLLPNSVYTVTFATPTGYLPTQANSGDDVTDSDPVNSTVRVPLGTQDDLTIDAGFVRLASIGDYVWYDIDTDGIQDSDETGVAGVTVELLDSRGMAILTTTTNASGYYRFTNLLPATYSVRFTPPVDYTISPQDQGGDDTSDSDVNPANGETVQTVLTSGEHDPTWDMGIYMPPATIGDYVWLDANRDGLQDSNEVGIGGVTVKLLDSSGAVISTTTTNASGYYSFTHLLPGDYAVQFVSPTGYLPSPQDQGGNDASDSDVDPTTGRTVTTTLSPNETDPTWDAGFYPVVNLGNLVWHDANNNGMVDTGEAGIRNVEVQLFSEGDDPTTATPLATVTTDASGNYNFDNLTPGRYFVYLPTPPLAYPWSSTPTDTADNGEDNDDNGSQSVLGAPVMSPVIELTVNSEPTNDGDGANGDLTVDFGFFAPASLGDLVWFDTNKDGVQDQGETGVPGTTDERGVAGVLVTLYDGVTNSIVATTMTGTNGRYLFDNLLPGDYYVQFTLPSGYSLSPADQGGNDAFDSDANATTLRTPVTNLTSGEHDPTLDMGIYLPTEPASIGDLVWYDTDRDGVQDSGETGVPGITVTLYRADGSPVATTTTDVNGAYEFNSLPPGDYYVAFTPPAAYTISPQDAVADNDGIDSDVDPATGHTVITTLLAGENDPTWDLGLYLADQPASIGDTVWFDGDVNGLQDAGETGVPGVLVTLYRADGLLVATTHTDVDGHYQFTNLVPGDYFVEFSPPSDYYGTHPDQGTADDVDSDADPLTGRTAVTTLTAGENDPTWDYGIFLFDERTASLLAPAEIGNRVWLDADHDGVQDPGEVNVPGVTVKLYTSDGQLVAIDITDANGVYGFVNLVPGAYYVEFVLPDGYSYSPAHTLPGDDTDSNADPATGRTPVVTLPSNTIDPTWDAGIYPTPTDLDDNDEPVKVRILLPLIAR